MCNVGINSNKVLPDTISNSVDRQMDAEQMEVDAEPVSLQNGPVTDGRAKRKARKPAIKEEDSDEEILPKVSLTWYTFMYQNVSDWV